MLKAAPLLAAPGSTSVGFVPPTKSVTPTALPLLALVRKVCTARRLPVVPLRPEGTLLFTTRTWYVALPATLKL